MGLLLLRASAPPPVGFLLVFIPAVFLGTSWLTNRLMGIPALYRDWPADSTDPIEQNVGWQQVEFGAFRGHSPMFIKFGNRCLHLKQPFPFQLFYWLGPASIPWREVRLEQAPAAGWLGLLGATAFRLGAGGRVIRLRGKAAKLLLARMEPATPAQPASASGRGAIRPR